MLELAITSCLLKIDDNITFVVETRFVWSFLFSLLKFSVLFGLFKLSFLIESELYNAIVYHVLRHISNLSWIAMSFRFSIHVYNWFKLTPSDYTSNCKWNMWCMYILKACLLCSSFSNHCKFITGCRSGFKYLLLC